MCAVGHNQIDYNAAAILRIITRVFLSALCAEEKKRRDGDAQPTGQEGFEG